MSLLVVCCCCPDVSAHIGSHHLLRVMWYVLLLQMCMYDVDDIKPKGLAVSCCMQMFCSWVLFLLCVVALYAMMLLIVVFLYPVMLESPLVAGWIEPSGVS